MAHKLDRSFSSLTAIAAASLLLSTTAPALAQTQDTAAQPATTVQPQAQPETPQAAPPQAAPPEPAAPAADAAMPATPVAPTMTTTPVVQPIPETPTATAEPAAPTPTTPRTTQATPRQQTPAPQQATPAPRPASAPVAAKPAPAPVARTTTQTSSSTLTRRDPAGLYNADGTPTATTDAPAIADARQSPYARYWPLEAAGAIVVIGLIGYAFTRRRDEEDETQPYETLAYEAPPEPVAVTPAPVRAHAPSLAMDTGTSADILPAGPIPTGEARTALLDKMVAAPPDEANPFTTVKARLRRARMILSARKQSLHEQATETFDWRTYKPSLRHATLEDSPDTPVKPDRATIK